MDSKSRDLQKTPSHLSCGGRGWERQQVAQDQTRVTVLRPLPLFAECSQPPASGLVARTCPEAHCQGICCHFLSSSSLFLSSTHLPYRWKSCQNGASICKSFLLEFVFVEVSLYYPIPAVLTTVVSKDDLASWAEKT